MSSFDEFVKNFVNDMDKINPKLAKTMKDLADKIKDHEFDENSKLCKECSSFKSCMFNAKMIAKIKSANLDDNIEETLIDFVDWIKHESKLLEIFDADDVIKDKDFKLYSLVNRFKDCEKHLEVLTAILDEDELKYIRKIIRGITSKIDDLFDKIMNINRTQMNKLIFILQKPQQEAKRYEDMTREELLEELKKK